MAEYALLGKRIPKPDAINRVTGRMVYADDMTLPGVLAGKILGRPVAHGRIRRLDVSKAAKLPGVRAVVTAQDAPTIRYGGIVRDKLIFATDAVRYHGDPIAAVAADNVDIAEEALHLIDVEIEALPALIDPKEAAHSSTMIHEGWEGYPALPNLGRQGNVTSSGRVQWGDVQQGFAQADYVFEDRYDIAMAHQTYIEPRAAMAYVEPTGRISVWTATQGIFPLRDSLAGIFGMPQTKVRVVPTEVGGGFGGKIAAVTEPPAVLVARQARAYYGNGAYHIATGYNFGEGMAGRLTGPYNFPHADLYACTVYTN